MKVDLTSENPALKSIFNDPKQIITLDANFLIPPDRHRLTIQALIFRDFSTCGWILFSKLSPT